jgi:hypothetical protein
MNCRRWCRTALSFLFPGDLRIWIGERERERERERRKELRDREIDCVCECEAVSTGLDFLGLETWSFRVRDLEF